MVRKAKKIKVRKKTNVKDTAWRWFSKYIRLRDCIATTAFPDQCYCVTCGKCFPYREIQAGHALGGRNDSILFDEELVNGQCEHCNKSVNYGGLGGNYGAYSVWFINKYGMSRWEEKVFLSNSSVKLSTPELEEISDKYRIKYHKLCDKYRIDK